MRPIALLSRICWLALAGLLSSCGPSLPFDKAIVQQLPDNVDFNFHIKPILSDRCFACHGPDAKARKAGLRLDTEQGLFEAAESGKHAFSPGSLRKSEAFHRIVSSDPEYQMPTPESNLSLTEYEKALIAKWISQGAQWKKHWAFSPPVKPEIPALSAGTPSVNPIDAFVGERLAREGLSFAPEADKERLLRRVTFDLTGLPPTLEEQDAFLADSSAQAYEHVVDRLLQTEASAERLATEWLDIARFADSHGYQDDGLRDMSPWRDWVIGAFQKNMPMDQFVVWQLAGDMLPSPTREQVLATAFNRNHMQSQEGGIVLEEYRTEYVADRAQTFSKAFLGLTMECSRCHDHKYDPISQKEYFQLFSFFNSVNECGAAPYSGTASPALTLTDARADSSLNLLEVQIGEVKRKREALSAGSATEIQAWIQEKSKAPKTEIPGLLAHIPLEEGSAETYANSASSKNKALFGGDKDRPLVSEPGVSGKGILFRGDSYVYLPKPLGWWERNQPWSLSLWVKPMSDSVPGPLFSKTGGLFNGNRGYVCSLLEDGRIAMSLNHVWPDNCIEVRTADCLPVGEWTHLTVTYDGLSQAQGLKVYLNGELAERDVLNDQLTRSTLYTNQKGNWSYAGDLTLGKRDTETLSDVAMDEWRVYDRDLNAAEVMQVAGIRDPFGKLSQPETQELYLSQNKDYQALTTEIRLLSGKQNDILTEQKEVMVMRELPQPRPTYILVRGQYDAPSRQVWPGTPASVLPLDTLRYAPNRLGLAQWLFDPAHPLTARVLANRYWQLMFGRGLVATPEDFGNQGALPTHPELLDWLAVTFQESKWDLRALLKTMVMSATYRQSSFASPELRERDPSNLLLARGPSQRLPSEMMRDQVLCASGLLVRTVGGPSVKPYQPAGLWEALATRNATVYEQDHGPSLYRRTLYTLWKRTSPHPALLSLDAADRSYCNVRRQNTSTPPQALVLLNDPQYVEAARILAEKMIREGGPNLPDRLARGFRALTGRKPREEEIRILETMYLAEKDAFSKEPTRAEKLLATGEYPRDRKLPQAEVAALTLVASAMMNSDEAVMKR